MNKNVGTADPVFRFIFVPVKKEFMQLEIRSHHFELLPQRAVYWVETGTLLIADLHIGKVMHFRKDGIAIPAEAAENNLHRLEDLVQVTCPRRIILLGDLFHHTYNSEWEGFVHWRRKHPDIEMVLVKGNHDILEPWLLHDAAITLHEACYVENGFCFRHHPGAAAEAGTFSFSGHVHPVFMLTGKARKSMRLPCFLLDPGEMVLPGFGEFTGGHRMLPALNRRVFVIAGPEVYKVG